MTVCRVFIAIWIVALLSACGDLGGEPEVVATRPPDQPPTPEPVAGTVSGRIVLGTAGASLPDDLAVTLRVFDPDEGEESFESTIDAEGTFVFDDVMIHANRRYYVTVLFARGFFVSDIVRGDPANPVLELPITVYERTDDPEAVTITLMLLQFELGGEGLQVSHIVNVRNETDRLFLSEDVVTEYQQASLYITLPPDALNIEFSDPERFALTIQDKTVVDTQPVFPEEVHPVHVFYELPFEDGREEVTFPVNYRLEGVIQFALPESLTVAGDTLTRVAGASEAGDGFVTYEAEVTLAAGESFAVEVIEAIDE